MLEVRTDWLAGVREEILDPERPLVDAHHHFFDESTEFSHYDLDDYWADTATHNVEQTVFVQCEEHHRKEGPEALAPVGETEWVDQLARESARAGPGKARVGAIVGTADLRLGAAVREVLEAHRAASPLFRGIREATVWADDPAVYSTDTANLYGDRRFREGFAELAPQGLSYDAYQYHTQIDELIDLARAFPSTTIVADHLCTPLGIGGFAGRRAEIFADWRKGVAELASCANVVMKLGGLAMPWCGFAYENGAKPPTSDALIADQGDYYYHAIDCFGPDRCLFESNFPVDKLSVSYGVLWNFFKKVAARYTEDEQESLLRGTAMRVYRLEPVS